MEYPFKDLKPLDEVTARTGYYRDWSHIDADTFHQISELVTFIRDKGYGADTREAIAQALERVYHDALQSGNANMEVSMARKHFKDLASRLDATDEELISTAMQLVETKQAFNDSVSKVTTDSEVILARGGMTTLGERIDSISNSLDVIPENIEKLYESLYDGIARENGVRVANTGLTSTFSGYGSTIGRQDNFNAVTLELQAFDATLIPNNIRVIIRYDDYQGEIISDVTTGINLTHNAWREVSVKLNTTINNPSGRTLWLEYHTDGRVANKTINNISGVDLHMRYSVTASLTDLTMRDTYSPATTHIWVATNHFTEGLSQDFVNELIADINLSPELINYNPFSRLFEEKLDVSTRIESPTGSRMYTTSVFSGWGAALDPTPSVVEGIRFRFRNRDIASNSVLLYITKNSKSGEILARKRININSKPFEDVVIEWELNTPIDNSANDYLYFSFQSDQYVDCYGYYGSDGGGTIYGIASYSMDGVQSEPSKLRDVSGDDSRTRFHLEFEGFTVLDRHYVATDMLKESLDMENSLRVVLPDEITAVVGDTLQLFYRGIVEAVNPYNYDIRVTCAKGRQFPRYFEFTPLSADVGTHELTVEVRDDSGNLIKSADTKIKVVNPKSHVSQKNILSIGDSLTSAGTWVIEANRRLTQSGGAPTGNNLNNFNFIGTKKNDDTGWEGVGGWTWNNYLTEPSPTTSDIYLYVTSHDKTNIDQKSLWKDGSGNTWELETIEATRLKFNRVEGNTSAPQSGAGSFTHMSNATNTSTISYTDLQFADGNPFWDASLGRVSFKSYCTRNGFSGIDYLYTLLTWNGGRSDKYDPSHNQTEINQAKQLIDILHSEYPNAQVRMMGVQLPSLNGGTGANYGAVGGYSHAYALVRGVFGLNLAYQEFANRDEYKDFVKFVNVSSQFDSENLMPEIDKPVNTRSSKTEKLGTNGVHPTGEGYLAIGDVAYRSILGDVE